MEKNRVQCEKCDNFVFPVFNNMLLAPIEKAKCKLGKRVMFRSPKNYDINNDFGWIRCCNDFKERVI